jgi:polysaccharide biosynthesis protein PslA
VNAHQEVLSSETWKPRRTWARPLTRKNLRLMLYVELLLLDIAAFTLGFLIAKFALDLAGQPRNVAFVAAALFPLYAVVAVSRGAYSRAALERASESVRRSLTAFALSVFMILIVAFLLTSGSDIPRLGFSVGVIATAALMIMGRVLVSRHAFHISGGKLINELLLLDGFPRELAPSNAVVLDTASIGLKPDLHDPAMLSFFGNLVAAFDRVVVHSRSEHHRNWSLLLKGANVNGEIVMHNANEIGAIAIGDWDGRDTLIVSRQPLSLTNRMKKRLLDLAISLPLLVLLSPALLVIALAIKLDSPGPIFFKQDRVGRGNRLFKVVKFRSMQVDLCDTAGNRSTSREDKRVTRVGRFIRATSIDELPQLFNVLSGDMSLVGPRPHALGSLAGDRLFWQVDDKYWLRHQLKPGITGLAQVRGFRGATAEATDLTDRLLSDMEYIQGWDIWRDLSILANTFRVVIHRNAF